MYNQNMKTINEKLDISFERTNALDMYLPSAGFAVLDLETMGISPAYNPVILSGMITVNEEGINLKQFFATSPEDEEELLRYTLKELSALSYVITYNGKTFDMPFLDRRMKKYGLEMPDLFNLDLYHLFRHYSDLPKLIPKLNQKTLEEYAGIATLREDRISGGESVDLYNQYVETGSMDFERRILLHNSDDVKQLSRLMALLRNCNIHRAFHKNGFPISRGRITGVSINKGDMNIEGRVDAPIDYISFPSIERPYHLQITKSNGQFTINLPCEIKEKNVFINLGFLDSENKALLESLPAYVNGFLILVESGNTNYIASNLLAREIADFALSEALE